VATEDVLARDLNLTSNIFSDSSRQAPLLDQEPDPSPLLPTRLRFLGDDCMH
jgi:hypothetical protein